MVLWQLLAEVRRHPLVALAGLLLTFALVYVVNGWPPVYSTRVSAVFLNPRPVGSDPTEVVNPYQGSRENLVGAAGVVARMVNADSSGTLTGSDSVSLVGLGVKSGYTIALPNSGGQWVYRFDRAELDVQVVGRSPVEVQQLLDQALGEIRQAIEVREREAGAPETAWIRVQQSPQQAEVATLTGDRQRAAGVALLIGMLLTLTAVHVVRDDRRWFRRRGSTAAPAGAQRAASAVFAGAEPRRAEDDLASTARRGARVP